MSVGTIPIISYQDWFFPALEHMKNAIVYSGKDDLLIKIRQVLEMPASEVQELSKRVMDYYDKYLAPVFFKERFENNNESICTLMLFPKIKLAEKEEARLRFIYEGILRHLNSANITHYRSAK
jgi:hypothetical protein